MTQLEMKLVGHGGAREGAGRPSARRGVAHVARARITKSVPVLVTLRVAREVPTLRRPGRFAVLREAVAAAGNEEGRIVHFVAEDDHVHFTAEVVDRAALTRLVRRFSIRVARRMNALLGRTGAFFGDRYHVQRIGSPKQCRATINYVLNNHRHHAHERGDELPADWVDPYSSAVSFDGWEELPDVFASCWDPNATAPPRTWLLAHGWRRNGAVRIDEVPAVRRKRKRGRRVRG